MTYRIFQWYTETGSFKSNKKYRRFFIDIFFMFYFQTFNWKGVYHHVNGISKFFLLFLCYSWIFKVCSVRMWLQTHIIKANITYILFSFVFVFNINWPPDLYFMYFYHFSYIYAQKVYSHFVMSHNMDPLYVYVLRYLYKYFGFKPKTL